MSAEVLDERVTGVTGVQANEDAALRDTPETTATGNGVAESPIPGESERPCYRVLDDFVDLGDRKLPPGVWAFGVRAGKGEAPPTLTQSWICSPLHVDAVTTDAHGGNFGRLLRFRTTLGNWRGFAMPMELLRGDGADLRGELLAMGVEIDPSQRNALAMYLQHRPPKRRILCALQVGWAAGGGAFVLPDEVIGPKAAGVAFQSSERAADEYSRAGTLSGWQGDVAALAVGNPLLMLAMCSAFTGPLLLRCGAESGGIHLVGDSSTGKTTCVDVACSVWGGPTFARTWRATANGLEGVASLMNDSLLALDEISQCDPREVGAIVYQLGNGQGKQRASRTGNARPVLRWRCSVLSSGERTIGTTMAEGGHRVKAGQTVRLLDVPAQRKYGAWDALHGSATGAAFSDRLKVAARQHYGHAGRAFLQRLTRDTQTDFSEALEAIKALNGFAAAGDDGQAKRAAARFALLAQAGELATAYGVTSWPEGAAIEAAAAGFRAWQRLRGIAVGGLERQQVGEKLQAFIERHGDARFSDADGGGDVMVRDRAGWWRGGGGDRRYLLTGDGMREALQGFDFGRALDVLQELGAIEKPGADGKRAKPMRIGGRTVRLYEVKPAALTEAAA